MASIKVDSFQDQSVVGHIKNEKCEMIPSDFEKVQGNFLFSGWNNIKL